MWIITSPPSLSCNGFSAGQNTQEEERTRKIHFPNDIFREKTVAPRERERRRRTTTNRPLSQKIGGIRNFRTTLNRPCHRDDTKVCAYTKIFYFFPSRAQFGAEQIALVSFFLLSSTRTSGAHRYELLGEKGVIRGGRRLLGCVTLWGERCNFAVLISFFSFILRAKKQRTFSCDENQNSPIFWKVPKGSLFFSNPTSIRKTNLWSC